MTLSSTLIPLLLLGVVLSCCAAERARETLRFDNGSEDTTTVIGLFADNGLRYRQRVDFTLTSTDGITNPRVLVHAHVGKEIKPEAGKAEPEIAVRINGGPWHWKPLKPYADNSSHWIDVTFHASQLRIGLNTIEVDSTVASKGNFTPTSLDMLGSRAAASTRSWHTHDFRSYRRTIDRNWEIRMEFERSTSKRNKARSLAIRPAVAQTGIGEPVQFLVDARDDGGRPVDPGAVAWSSDLGTVDGYGLFVSQVTGAARVLADADGLTAEAKCDITLQPPAGVAPATSSRRLQPRIPSGHLDLNGEWQFRLDPDNAGEKQKWQGKADSGNWSTIHVPGCWQAQGYGLDYHGVAWYRRGLRIPADWKGQQVWLRFEAAATHAKVWVNGKLAGEHLGNWSPFELRVTDLLRAGKANSVVVRVAEMREHFSAGFLPEIAAHFGGIWQPVTAFARDGARLNDVFVRGEPATNSASIEADIIGVEGSYRLSAVVSDPEGREVGRAEKIVNAAGWDTQTTSKLTIAVKNAKLWSPRDPALYTARIEISSEGSVLDSRELRFGFRTVATRGTQLLLNGEPIYAQGILHWGYYPDLVSIDPSEERIRKEFADLKAHGYNMVKACLFYMPKRFYEIADETGMLIWQEHPVWQTYPKENESGDRPEIVREFEEWFRFDRNHPSVILRSMTCEAHTMHKELTDTIYSLGKSLTGGELMEDNSAYLNTKHTDWYDIHTYVEVDMFAGLWSQHWKPDLAKRPTKPFVVGEDLDYDTYRSLAQLRYGLGKDGVTPWWIERDASWSLQEDAEADFVRRFGAGWPREMHWRQNRHSLIARKAVMEDYRKQPEFAGHVMTGIRDNLQTRNGFYDDLEQPKWSPEELRRFLGDRVLLLDTPRHSPCFRYGEEAALKLTLSNFGEPVQDATLTWRLMHGEKLLSRGESKVSTERGAVATLSEIRLSAPNQPGPIQCRLLVEMKLPDGELSDDWSLWFFPERDMPESDALLLTDSLDADTRKALIDGATVVYVPKDDDATLPRRELPFWREMAIWLPTDHPALGDFPHEGFPDLQFIDMSQRKPFDTREFRHEITPLVWGVNARYYNGVVLADYVFEARVGKGKLLACCLNTRGDDNIAGPHLFEQLVRYAGSEAFDPSGSEDGALVSLLR